jgi:hypothetical protein
VPGVNVINDFLIKTLYPAGIRVARCYILKPKLPRYMGGSWNVKYWYILWPFM